MQHVSLLTGFLRGRGVWPKQDGCKRRPSRLWRMCFLKRGGDVIIWATLRTSDEIAAYCLNLSINNREKSTLVENCSELRMKPFYLHGSKTATTTRCGSSGESDPSDVLLRQISTVQIQRWATDVWVDINQAPQQPDQTPLSLTHGVPPRRSDAVMVIFPTAA